MARNKLGEIIRNAVKKTGMTQQNFAKKIDVGESMISQWISGKRNPSLNTLKKISRETDVPLKLFLDACVGNVLKDKDANLREENIILKKENSLLKKEIALLKREMRTAAEKLRG